MKNFDSYIITYSNYFKVDNKIFAFRKKHLFDITDIPQLLKQQENGNSKGYWINRKWFSLSRIKSIIINESINIDVGCLQWYAQIKLDKVFNLD